MIQFLNALPTITKLELTGIEIRATENIKLPITLKSIKIRRTRGLTDVNTNFLSKLTSLSKLSLISCSGFKGDFIQHIPTSVTSLKLWFNNEIRSLQYITRLKNIQLLDLSSANISNDEIKYIPPTISKLILYDLSYITKEVLWIIPQNLVLLEIQRDLNLNGIELPKTLQILILTKCMLRFSMFNFPPSLRQLHLHKIEAMDAVDFSRVPRTLQKLIVLRFQFPFMELLKLPNTCTRIQLQFQEFDKKIKQQVEEVVEMLRVQDRHLFIKLEFIKNELGLYQSNQDCTFVS